MKFPGAEPDLMAGKSFDLKPYGFTGKVIHSPGHTHGSMVVLMEDGRLITGDTMFGLENKLHFPPFAEDLPSLVRSWQMIRQLPVQIFYPAHGRHFTIKSFMEEYDTAIERYSR